uniref:Uncharacterized protein n=1 Tax=Romanomermis culicivorax TaxID=13658 RepID=A0A915LA28_ROMCU
MFQNQQFDWFLNGLETQKQFRLDIENYEEMLVQPDRSSPTDRAGDNLDIEPGSYTKREIMDMMLTLLGTSVDPILKDQDMSLVEETRSKRIFLTSEFEEQKNFLCVDLEMKYTFRRGVSLIFKVKFGLRILLCEEFELFKSQTDKLPEKKIIGDEYKTTYIKLKKKL